MDKQTLSQEEIDRIASAILDKAAAFRIKEEDHYNQHKRLERLLEAYESATNIFWKTFLSFIIVGAIVLAGATAIKGP